MTNDKKITNYYKAILGFAIMFASIFHFPLLAQKPTPQSVINKLGKEPLYIVDSIRIQKSDLQNYSPDSIASVNVLYDTIVTKRLFGDAGKDGAVVIETKVFARQKFISYFKSVSSSYDSLYLSKKSDSSFLYILNNKVQTGNYEGNLSGIDNKNFISLNIISKEELLSKYNTSEFEYGIFIIKKENEIKSINKEKKKD